MKLNLQRDLIVVKTDRSFLLVYSLTRSSNSNSDDETLTVYNSSSAILQNGLVLHRQLNFFETNPIETPIHTLALRFKLLLKVAHGIIDFVLLNTLEMLLVTNDNVQLLNFEKEEPILIPVEGNVSKLCAMGNDVLMLKIDGTVQLLKRAEQQFTPMEHCKLENVIDCVVNDNFGLIIFLREDSLVYYNYDIHEIIKETPLKNIKSLEWSPDGNTLLVLFNNKTWSLLSTFGCTMFNSSQHDYESPWLTSVACMTCTPDSLYSSDGTTLFVQRLLHSTCLNPQTNHDLKRQVLICDSSLHVYTGHEMAISSTRAINWNIIKIPFEQYHQIPNIKTASISQDGKFIAVANESSLLLYSFLEREWSFYQNDYNHSVAIGHITWFNKLNLLIATIKTTTHSELVIFDLRKFNHRNNFNSDVVVFQYDLSGDIQLLNVLDDDIVMYTTNNKYYHFKITTKLTGLKIDLIKILSMDKLFKSTKNLRSVIKVNDTNNDLLMLQNGELILINETDGSYRKSLLFDKVEYIYKISNEEFYLFNGENLLLIKNFSQLITTKDVTNTVLSVNPMDYPLLLVLEKGLFVTMENSLIKKKTMELNSITSRNSIFLHDLIRFEMTQISPAQIYEKYMSYKNFAFALELLLYKTVTQGDDLSMVIELIKLNPIHELTVVCNCLRKIETRYWSKLLHALGSTPQGLLQRCIELKEWKSLAILIIIFLNYQDSEEEVVSLEEDQLIHILKLLYDNASDDDDLWETSFEMLRFLKLLDPTGALLRRSQEVLSN